MKDNEKLVALIYFLASVALTLWCLGHLVMAYVQKDKIYLSLLFEGWIALTSISGLMALYTGKAWINEKDS